MGLVGEWQLWNGLTDWRVVVRFVADRLVLAGGVRQVVFGMVQEWQLWSVRDCRGREC